MLVSEVLTLVNETRPNAQSKLVKLQFLNEIEGEVFDYMCGFHPASIEEKNSIDARRMMICGWQADLIEDGQSRDDRDKQEKIKNGFSKDSLLCNACIQRGRNILKTVIADPFDRHTLDSGKNCSTTYELKPYTMADDDARMLLPDRFSGVYVSYVRAKLDYLDAETEEYTNDAMMHQAELDAWKQWYIRTHLPRQVKTRGIL